MKKLLRKARSRTGKPDRVSAHEDRRRPRFSRELSVLYEDNAVVVLDKPAGLLAVPIDNLQMAFNGESNAHHRYVAFAKKADDEGYGEVASLFRAAARAEEIHASNHSAVIRKLGAEPKATIEAPAVASTRENLQVAISGETYERDQMYPAFISEAKASKNSEAIRTFTYALKTEAEHARLYSEALKNLDKLRGKSRTYYVCGVCGALAAAVSIPGVAELNQP